MNAADSLAVLAWISVVLAFVGLAFGIVFAAVAGAARALGPKYLWGTRAADRVRAQGRARAAAVQVAATARVSGGMRRALETVGDQPLIFSLPHAPEAPAKSLDLKMHVQPSPPGVDPGYVIVDLSINTESVDALQEAIHKASEDSEQVVVDDSTGKSRSGE